MLLGGSVGAFWGTAPMATATLVAASWPTADRYAPTTASTQSATTLSPTCRSCSQGLFQLLPGNSGDTLMLVAA